MGVRTWMYHKDYPKGRIFDSDAIPAGWVDSPAKINAAPELAQMSKRDLEAYARERFGVELDRRKSHSNLVAEVKALHDNAE